jgi:acyl-CoA thioesterase FadM
MFPAPATPSFPPGFSVTSSAFLRYEDVTMDGRLIALGAPAGLAGLWRELLVDHPGARNAIQLGIIPILTRFTISTGDTSIRVDRPVETRNGFALAHDLEGGVVSRLFMNIWCEIYGVAGRLGRTNTAVGPTLAGTVFAEHTFTRPMALPHQRKVTRLGVDGYPDVPELRYAQPRAETAADAPDGATFLDELSPDSTDYVFTLDQTDSNQHVNSLVYVRLFMEAVNRRLAQHGKALRLRTQAVDVGYRKPCFAGDRVRAHLRLFQLGESLGAAGSVIGDDGKPRCYVRVALAT